MKYNKNIISHPSAAGTAYTPLVPRSVSAAPYAGVMCNQMIKFVVEDEKHAEPQGEYDSFDGAFMELVRRSQIAWDLEPNQCPCMSWKTYGRDYQILKYDISTKPYWTLLNSTPVLGVSAKGVNWE